MDRYVAFNIILAGVFIVISIAECSVLKVLWQLPTQQTMEKALTKCFMSNDIFTSPLYNTNDNCTEVESEKIRCIASYLDLWHNDQGFNGKRLAKMFHKSKMSTEIITVVDYCNLSTLQQLHMNKWTCEAYHCFTSGQLGTWMKRYIDDLYKVKKN